MQLVQLQKLPRAYDQFLCTTPPRKAGDKFVYVKYAVSADGTPLPSPLPSTSWTYLNLSLLSYGPPDSTSSVFAVTSDTYKTTDIPPFDPATLRIECK